MVVFFYGFLWLSTLYSSFVTIYIRKQLKLLPMLDVSSFYSKIKYFPILLIIWWSPPTIDRIIQMAGTEEIFFFDVLHIFCESSYGFCNMMLYAMNPRVKNIIMNKIRRIFNKIEEESSISFEGNSTKLYSLSSA